MARLAVTMPRRIVGITVLFVMAAAVFGISAASRLSPGGFLAPASESARAAATLAQKFDRGDMDLVLLVSSAGGAKDAPAQAVGTDIVRQVSAFMHVLGGLNWWAPDPLARWHHRRFSGPGPVRPGSGALRRSGR